MSQRTAAAARGATLALALGVVAGGPLGAPAAAVDGDTSLVLGQSREGRPLVAQHVGDLAAPVQMVVIGQLHGDEPGGRRVVDDLARASVPPGVGVWLVRSANPDGHVARSRTNSRGVDLNRNFPTAWRGQGRGTGQWSGPAAASEPETRALMGFLDQVRPAAVLGFHQAYDLVDITHPRSRAAGRRLAAWMGERAAPVGCGRPCRGTMTQWVDARLGAVAITVELDDRVSAEEARRAAGAVLRLGRWLGR